MPKTGIMTIHSEDFPKIAQNGILVKESLTLTFEESEMEFFRELCSSATTLEEIIVEIPLKVALDEILGKEIIKKVEKRVTIKIRELIETPKSEASREFYV